MIPGIFNDGLKPTRPCENSTCCVSQRRFGTLNLHLNCNFVMRGSLKSLGSRSIWFPSLCTKSGDLRNEKLSNFPSLCVRGLATRSPIVDASKCKVSIRAKCWCYYGATGIRTDRHVFTPRKNGSKENQGLNQRNGGYDKPILLYSWGGHFQTFTPHATFLP